MRRFAEDRTFSILWFIFIFCMVLILAGAIAAPVLENLGVCRLAHILYRFYHLTCHQLSARSWFICNAKMAVCVRCLGIYTGLIATGLLLLLSQVRRFFIEKSFLRFILPLTVGLLLPLIVDGVIQLCTLWESLNMLRFATGILAGAGSSILLGFLFLKMSDALESISRQ